MGVADVVYGFDKIIPDVFSEPVRNVKEHVELLQAANQVFARGVLSNFCPKRLFSQKSPCENRVTFSLPADRVL